MASAEEALGAKNILAAALAAGVEVISQEQEITFTRYRKLILPLDGYVFWVKETLISQSAIFNNIVPGRTTLNAFPKVLESAPTFDCKGSLHYASDTRQEETETYAANRVVFTAEQEVQSLNDIGPDHLWLGEFDGIRFAFSSRSSFYFQSDLFHYVGFAVFADMVPQIIDSFVGFDRRQIVSNSLPAWLSLNTYNPGYGFGNTTGIKLYPSMLVPANIVPPFAAVHIDPAGTRAVASAPTIDPKTSTHTQLCSDRVRITLWGARNFSAADFLDMVYQFSSDFPGAFGIQNIPSIRDEKRNQTELFALAQKKTLDFDVSYLQQAMRNIAQQLLSTVIPSFEVGSP